MKDIDPYDLVPINAFGEIITDPVYTFRYGRNTGSPLKNKFPGLYHRNASVIWGHKDIVTVTLLAARICRLEFNWRLRVADCLRTIDAQIAMSTYGYHSSLVSLPGSGAHPRAMAIDIVAEKKNRGRWQLVNMGTDFDDFPENPEKENPAARDYTEFNRSSGDAVDIFLNRQRLEFSMRKAAALLGFKIWPLEQEWWDFRFPSPYVEEFKPLREDDLLPAQKQLNPDINEIQKILNGRYPDAIKSTLSGIMARVNDIFNRYIYAPHQKVEQGL